MSPSPSPPPPRDATAIDRQTTTPFLLNFCYRSSAFHNLAEFPIPTPSDPKPALPAHLQIYTWYSCTLKELAHLLTSALPHIVPDPAVGTRLSFRLVYPDTSPAARGIGRLDDGRPRYVSREMGSVVISAPFDHATSKVSASFELGGDDSDRTLAETRFVIGDYIDCAIFPPLSDGSVVPRASVGGSRPAFRDHDYGVRGKGYGLGGHGGTRGGSMGEHIPSGEWRRGERLPDAGPYRGGGFRGGRGRRDPY